MALKEIVCICLLIFYNTKETIAKYEVGVGIADITGPAAEITFMGYGKLEQKGTGLHLRQFARCFIISEAEERLAFVSIDNGMMGDGLRMEILRVLKQKFGSVYNTDNVMLSGTHTHSAPGGYLQHLLFDLSTFGFIKETFDGLVDGIVRCIERAHDNLQPGRIFVTQGELLDANYNRSPFAYEANPEEEKARYRYDVDKMMVQIKFESSDGRPLGAINWFPVHPTSMNNTNTLVSSDNVGYAAVLFEQHMNPGRLIGKGPFVAAFASTNLGDVSPNIRGPKCLSSGASCLNLHSTCPSRFDHCIASGPGRDMFESTKIIAERLYSKAVELWNNANPMEVSGSVKVIHQYVDMPKQEAMFFNTTTGRHERVRGCLPAMGHSFAAGTTDGPGAFSFKQGEKTPNPLWNVLRDFFTDPPSEYLECHGAKPVFLATGLMSFPFSWQPSIVSTQLGLIGNVAIACVPGEFTTMSGRRLRNTIKQTMTKGGINDGKVIIAGLCNTYSDYITTPEEYSVQRYEGASTIYGPHTLTIYLSQYRKLTNSLLYPNDVKHTASLLPFLEIHYGNDTCVLRMTTEKHSSVSCRDISSENKTPNRGPIPPELFNDLFTIQPPVIFDTSKIGYDFGDTTLEPMSVAHPGSVVKARFVSGHPRNNLRHEETFLTIERHEGNDLWEVVATDANWETKFHWIRKSPLLGTSEVEVEWTVPDYAEPGEYRIRHFGDYKYIFGGIYPYEGTSLTFMVENSHKKKRRHL